MMIISLTHQFIFVANLKTASTSIEHHLKRHAEIAVQKTSFGKHNPLRTIAHQFAWVNTKIPFEEFFVFGVLREPVDFLLSLFNSHQKEGFDGTENSTKGMSFEQYVDTPQMHAWQRKPQSERLIDPQGRLTMTHVVRFSDVNTEFPAICLVLGLPVAQLTFRNPSPKVATIADVSDDLKQEIRRLYARDYELYEHGPRDQRIADAEKQLKQGALIDG